MMKNLYKTLFSFFALTSCIGVMFAQSGESLSFGNTNDYISLGNPGSMSDWTIEFWLKRQGEINYQNLLHSDDTQSNKGVRVEISENWPNGHLYVSISGGNIFTPFARCIRILPSQVS